MDITEIPFNKFLGIRPSDLPEYILMLEKSEHYANHLGTVHASAQFSLAEATSGEYLLTKFKDFSENTIPVVRRVEVKYCKPANGKLYSKAELSIEDENKLKTDLPQKGRTLIKVKVTLFDQNGINTMQSVYEWYIQKM